MNAQVNVDMQNEMKGGSGAAAVGETVSRKVRPLLWSLRRELWENRSIYVAPIAVALLILFSVLVNVLRIPDRAVPYQQLLELQSGYFRAASLGMYGGVALVMAITAGLVTWFYCLDALFSERRDRSVLFWKSLPVSDTTTVLCKMIVAQLVIPLIGMLVGLALYLLLLIGGSILLFANGVSGGLLLGNASLGELVAIHLYSLVVASLWYAPLHAWLLFISSWVRRAALLWAILVPAAIGLGEYLAFETEHFWSMLAERFSGGLKYAFELASMRDVDGESDRDFDPSMIPDSLFDVLSPGNFFSQPGLWIGVLVAAALIAASIWMRRYREPL